MVFLLLYLLGMTITGFTFIKLFDIYGYEWTTCSEKQAKRVTFVLTIFWPLTLALLIIAALGDNS